jgi:hypothetical protein
MTQRLPDVLFKLYRPAADRMRQVFALSRGDAERLPSMPSMEFISITAPNGRRPGLTALTICCA